MIKSLSGRDILRVAGCVPIYEYIPDDDGGESRERYTRRITGTPYIHMYCNTIIICGETPAIVINAQLIHAVYVSTDPESSFHDFGRPRGPTREILSVSLSISLSVNHKSPRVQPVIIITYY